MAGLIPGKLLYLRSPHTASVATERAILQASSDAIVIVPGHCTLEDIEERRATSKDGKAKAADLLTGDELVVTTVRNPYDVIVTWWLRAGQKVPFPQFIREYNRIPQVRDGEIFGHRKHCDVVMNYENLARDFRDLMLRLELPAVEIPIDNTTPGKTSWTSYYDANSFAEANMRFGSEIEDLGIRLHVRPQACRLHEL